MIVMMIVGIVSGSISCHDNDRDSIAPLGWYLTLTLTLTLTHDNDFDIGDSDPSDNASDNVVDSNSDLVLVIGLVIDNWSL